MDSTVTEGGNDVVVGTVGAALEREHREIDEGLEAFAAGLAEGETRIEPLTRAIQALRRHIYIEEEMLFPSLRAAGMVAPVFVMLREHGDIWRTLDELEGQVSRGDSVALPEICKRAAAQLEAHNMKEEQILYTQADQVLGEPESAALNAFLATGGMPEGWVCARA
jgi:hemerythrin-like domain-containing protein